ncbi:MAG: AAA family ATPase [Candidatus Hodarchaeota archaeon]
MDVKNSLTLSISGKGGAGKTTLTALLLKHLLEFNKQDILVIDADPAMNLPNVLGIELQGKTTLGMILDKKKDQLEEGTHLYKKLLEGEIWESVINKNGFDLLIMGWKKGEGCYCTLDSFTAIAIESLTKMYDLILIDFYAGFEHLSRRTDRSADVLLIVTDPSKMGLETSRHIKELIEEINISFKDVFLVGNRFNTEFEQQLSDFSKEIGVNYAGIIPYDQNIAEFNLKGIPLTHIPKDSPALTSAKHIFKTIFQI